MLRASVLSVAMLVTYAASVGSVDAAQAGGGTDRVRAKCTIAPEERNCKGLFTVYHYNAATRRCAVVYGCYDAIFSDMDECRQACETPGAAPAVERPAEPAKSPAPDRHSPDTAVGESPSEALFFYLNAGHGDPAVVSKHLAAGADVNFRDEQYHITLLHNAAHYGRTDAARMLIARGAAVNARNSEGNTPLYAAAHEKHVEIVRLLLDSGAEVDVQNSFGYTPLRAACWARTAAIVRLLLAKGANVNIPDRRGHTALHVAVDQDDEESVNALIDGGASLNAKDRSGMTPLDRARRQGNPRMISILTSAGTGSL